MDTDHARLCLLLHSLPHVPRRQLRRLLQHFSSPELLFQASPSELVAAGATPAVVQDLTLARRRGRHPQALVDVDQQLGRLRATDARILVLGQSDYPPLLAAISDPPPFLYARGQLEALTMPQLAVVGSRKASAVGLRAATELAADAVAAGLAVTSGLALGIDGAAHRGALQARGTSVAVMATGIEAVYPQRHAALAAELLQAGCLVTEFPPLTPPLPGHFPARNRIISGLALGVLVIEAALPSGSLITAGTALEQGREVFALPWFPGHTGGRGCLHLLRDGAVLVQSIEDVVDNLGPLFDPPRSLAAAPPVVASAPPAAHWLLALMTPEGVDVDTLVAVSGRPLPEVLSALSALEAQGSVLRQAGRYQPRETGLATPGESR